MGESAMLFVGVWLLFAVLIGVAAGARGRSGVGWCLLAVLISPLLAGLILAILPDLRTRRLLEHIAGGRPAVDDGALASNVAGRRSRFGMGWMVKAILIGGLIALFLAWYDHWRAERARFGAVPAHPVRAHQVLRVDPRKRYYPVNLPRQSGYPPAGYRGTIILTTAAHSTAA